MKKPNPALFLRLLVTAALLQAFCTVIAPSKAVAQAVDPNPIVMDDAERPLGFNDELSRNARRSLLRGEWYFSWGYNTESWAPTDIHISQPSQASDFVIHNVKGHDEPGWNTGIFNKDLFIPQTNLRLGRFVDEARSLAVEFSLDHTKYTSNLGQFAHVTGMIAGTPTNALVRLDEPFFSYKLHNGANHAMFDLVKRLPLIGETNESLSVAAIAKVGVGLMLPHAENTIVGHDSDVGRKVFGNLIGMDRGWWQVNGWTTGIEVGFRVVLASPIYLELTDKMAYAYLDDVPVFQGTARHNLWMNEVILNLGITFGGRARFEQR